MIRREATSTASGSCSAHARHWRARAATAVLAIGALGACADLDRDGPASRPGGTASPGGPPTMGGGSSVGGSGGPPSSVRPPDAATTQAPSRPASQLDPGGAGAAATAKAGAAGADTVTSRPNARPDWVAVFESPREAGYSDQRVIYVDRNNLRAEKLDGRLTYYLARTREVRRNEARAKIQELAVLCEGAPIAPATSLRGEGTEDGNGNYALRQAPTPLTSVDQFSTQKVRIDPNNPNTFVIRAICLLGTERGG